MDDISQQIAALQTEIQTLEDVYREKLKEKRLAVAWRESQHCLIDSEVEDGPSTVEQYKHQINLLERLTDVKVIKTDVKVQEHGKLWLIKTFSIEGLCKGEEFELDLIIKDSMQESQAVISETISMTVKHCTVKQKEFKEHLKLLQGEKNVQGFFMLLHSYSTWSQIRDKTFQHFLSTYPNVVSQTNKASIQIEHINKPCVFQIDWSTRVLSNHTCCPELQLSVDMDKVSSSKAVLKKAPDIFQLMLKEIGIEKSINSLVTLCVE